MARDPLQNGVVSLSNRCMIDVCNDMMSFTGWRFGLVTNELNEACRADFESTNIDHYSGDFVATRDTRQPSCQQSLSRLTKLRGAILSSLMTKEYET